MRAEVISELGEADACLEVPWHQADGSARYLDLRGDPKAIQEIEPARRYRPLHNFLTTVNSADSVFRTAACRVWLEPETGETSEFASEIALCFALEDLNDERGHYEGLCRSLQELLAHEPGDAVRAELRVRRCRFGATGGSGFSLAVFLRARGETAGQAEIRWGLGLAHLQQALLFVSRAVRQRLAQASG
jgi:hypothetical protein